MNNRKKAWKCTATKCLMNMGGDIEICKRCKSYWRKRLPPQIVRHECPECGEIFLGRTNKTYCSRACQKAAYLKRKHQWATPRRMKPYEYRKCTVCGKEFYPHTDKQKTCGGRCSKEYLAKEYKRPRNEIERALRRLMRENERMEYEERKQAEAEAKQKKEQERQEILNSMLKITDVENYVKTKRSTDVEYSKKFLMQLGRYQPRGGDIMGSAKTLDTSIAWWRKLSMPRQAALLHIAVAIGTQDLLGCRRFLQALNQGLWVDAKRAFLFSKHGGILGKRAVEMARQIETGEWQKDPTWDIGLSRFD